MFFPSIDCISACDYAFFSRGVIVVVGRIERNRKKETGWERGMKDTRAKEEERVKCVDLWFCS